MAHPDDLDPDDVARQLHPVAVAHARTEVLIQLVALAAIFAMWGMLGFPRSLSWPAAILAVGVVATVADVRWWLWLRHAHPEEAYRRIQARDDLAAVRSRFTIVTSLAAAALWLWLAR